MPGSSPAVRRTVRSPTVRLLAGALAAVVLGLGPGAGTAAAHDVLIGTGPAADATVPTAPESVTLEFSDAPQALGTQVVVTGPSGALVSSGTPEVSGTTVRQQLAPGLAAGGYTVVWRVTSADGHPLSGTFGFRVSRGAAVDGEAAAGPAAPPAGGQTGTAAGDSSSAPVWAAIAAIVAVGGLVVVRQLRRPA